MEQTLDNLSKGSSMIFLGIIVASIFGFVNKAVIGKFFGPASLGVFSIALMWLGIMTKISTGGLESAIQKFIPKYYVDGDDNRLRSGLYTIVIISLIISLVVSPFLYYFSPYISTDIFNSARLIPVLRIVAVLIPIHSLMILLQKLFLAFKNTKDKVLINDFLFQTLRFIVIITAIIVGGMIVHVTFGYLLITLFVVVINIIIIGKKYSDVVGRREKKFSNFDFQPRKILRYSVPLLFSASLLMVMSRADTFMLGYFKNESQVGMYNLVLSLALFLTLFQLSINQIFFPVISHLHAEGKYKILSESFSIVVRWLLLSSLPFFLILIIFSRPILSIVFPQYVLGWKALTILSIGMMIRIALGPVGKVLETYGKTKFIFKVNASLVSLNLVLNFFLIPPFGIEGAAVATATTFSLNNLIEMYKVNELIHFTLNLKLLGKYLLSGALSVSLSYTLFIFLNIHTWWILAILFITIIFLFYFLLMIFNGYTKPDIYFFELIDIILQKTITKKKVITPIVKRFMR